MNIIRNCKMKQSKMKICIILNAMMEKAMEKFENMMMVAYCRQMSFLLNR